MKTINKSFVSIIILNYNTFEMTCDCIQSVIEKTDGDQYEIIVVDNASSECNPEKFKEKFHQIKLIKSQTNLGFSKGNNLGIKNAVGDTILLLNSDTILLNDAVNLCKVKLLQENKIGIITGKLMFPDGKIQKQCRRFETINLLLIEKLRLHKLLSKEKRAELLLGGYFDHTTEIICDRIWGTFFMFKRNILDFFPENKLSDQFFMYGEDNEWCYQLKVNTNKKILYYPKAKITHIMGGSRFKTSDSPEKMKIILKNKFIYMSEYYGKYKTLILFRLQGINLK